MRLTALWYNYASITLATPHYKQPRDSWVLFLRDTVGVGDNYSLLPYHLRQELISFQARPHSCRHKLCSDPAITASHWHYPHHCYRRPPYHDDYYTHAPTKSSWKKREQKITHTASTAIIPTIVHHKKITKKRRLLLTYRVVQAMKATASIIPLAALFFAPAIQTMPTNVIWAVAAFCFICTALAFTLQSLAVWYFRVTTADVW